MGANAGSEGLLLLVVTTPPVADGDPVLSECAHRDPRSVAMILAMIPVMILPTYISDYSNFTLQFLDNEGLDRILRVCYTPVGSAAYCPVCNDTI